MGKNLNKRSVFEHKSQKTQNLQFRLYFNKKYQAKDLHKWFESKVSIKKNFKILDVGCGTGKQSVYFKKKINNSIYNINNKIIIKLNSQSKDIKGVFLGLGDNGSLKIKVSNKFLEYYSVDSFFFPDEELS